MTRLNAIPAFSLAYARMFGLLVLEHLYSGDSEQNIYILAVRAFHNARIYLGD
jgi:hypothetical protein